MWTKSRTSINDISLYPSEAALQLLERDYYFPIKIKKSKRALRITLRVSQMTGEVRVTVPSNIKFKTLTDFINKNLGWIEGNLAKIEPFVHLSVGSSLPLHGLLRTIDIDPILDDSYELDGNRLNLCKTESLLGTQIKKVLKHLSEDYFHEKCLDYSRKLRVNYSKISLKDPRSRWGSCSSMGHLMFSWRLIMAPPEVSAYVAAHEVAHLVHMDHSSKFWRTVHLVCPNYNEHRRWLKLNGKDLHKFVF